MFATLEHTDSDQAAVRVSISIADCLGSGAIPQVGTTLGARPKGYDEHGVHT